MKRISEAFICLVVRSLASSKNQEEAGSAEEMLQFHGCELVGVGNTAAGMGSSGKSTFHSTWMDGIPS